MIKIEKTEVIGWENAIRGMRNPMNSWDKSDSFYDKFGIFGNDMQFVVGENDLKLMESLAKGGADDRKFMRMIVVYADITAPLYWWKEYDTYKVGTVANSCSTMHKIADKPFEITDFSVEHLISDDDTDAIDALGETITDYDYGICNVTSNDLMRMTIRLLNAYRDEYNKTKDKKYWWQMIQLLPISYNQKRTVMLNYEVLHNMYHARKNHKLDEWHEFCDWAYILPHADILIRGEGK